MFCMSRCFCSDSRAPTGDADGVISDPAPLPAPARTGPGGLSCQEWNRRVDANPYLAQEVAPKIEPCPAV